MDESTSGRFFISTVEEVSERAAVILIAWIGLFATGAVFSSLATAVGCPVNEGMTHACMFAGMDVRDALGAITVSPMLAAAFGAPLFLMALIFQLIRSAAQYLARDRSLKDS